MTPEIEQLRAEWQSAQNITHDAKRTEIELLDRLNEKVAAWAIDDLKERGIEIGKTPVNYALFAYRGASAVEWSTDRNALLVTGVFARNGQPDFRLAKVRKNGTPSGAYTGIYRQVVAVRKAEEGK